MNHRLGSQSPSRWKRLCRLALAALSLTVAFGVLAGQVVYAETINVTTPNDVIDANGGVCAGLASGDLPGPDGVVSLREALCAANTNSNPDTIVLPANTYLTTLTGSGEDWNAVGDLDILETGGDLTISGAGASTTVIDGNGTVIGDRVLDLPPLYSQLITVTISGVTLQHGSVPGGLGGGIYVDRPHNLHIEDSTIYSNTAQKGGGIYARLATLDIVGSTISENHGTLNGGGIYHDVGGATISIDNSTLSGNRATGATVAIGGGIYNVNGNIQISDSTLADNQAATTLIRSVGGAIYSADGTLDITNSRVLSNSATGLGGDGTGGGISIDAGTMTVIHSSLSGNIAQDHDSGFSYGGGIFVAGAAVTVTHGTISANQSLGGDGSIAGGIYVNDGTVVMTNTTVSGNLADASGGGIYNLNGTVKLDHVTVTGNVADNDGIGDNAGGGISRNIKPVDLKNTILAGNVDGSPTGANVGPDCFAGLNSHGNNLIGDETGCDSTSWQASDQVGGKGNPTIDPMLDPLADNMGAALTHALQPGSPAVDAGTCTDISGTTITNDQRMVSRPQGAACDIGAYEAEAQLAIIKTAAPTDKVPYHGAVTYTVVLTNIGAGHASGVNVADVLPVDVVFARWVPGGQPTGATVSGGALAWNGTFSGGQTITFAFVVTHTGDHGDQVVNTAQFNHAGHSGSDDAVFTVEAGVYLPILLKRTS